VGLDSRGGGREGRGSTTNGREPLSIASIASVASVSALPSGEEIAIESAKIAK
jgi:hypothetical protein